MSLFFLGGLFSTRPQFIQPPSNLPPTITQQPQSQSVTEGQPATFSVTATGTPPLTYAWERDPGTGVFAPVGTNAASYTTENLATDDDDDRVRVTVTNAFGSVVSAIADLNVIVTGQAPQFTLQPSSQSVQEGQSASFSTAATGTQPITFQWRRDIGGGPANISGANGTNYTTPPTVLADDGDIFSVTATNNFGTVTSGNATLTVTAAPPPGGQVNPTFTANRATNLVAPCALRFSASGSTSLNFPGYDEATRWRLFTASWNFDDPSSGTWTHTGQSKNSSGAGRALEAGHVYWSAGTYNPFVDVSDTLAVGRASLGLTIQDPNVFYSGTATVLVAPDSNFTTGRPAGLVGSPQELTLASGASFTCETGKRYLFRRGGSWGTLRIPHGSVVDVQCGDWGSGAKPSFTGLEFGTNNHPTAFGNVFCRRCTMYNLRSTGNLAYWIETIDCAAIACDVDNLIICNLESGFYAGQGTYTSPRWSTGVMILECTAQALSGTNLAGQASPPGDGDISCAGLLGQWSWIAGNNFTSQSPDQHNCRPYFMYKTLIEYNRMPGRPSRAFDPTGRHALKLQSPGTRAYSATWSVGQDDQISSYTVVRGNAFGSVTDTNDWCVGLTPENSFSNQGLSDMIYEYNVHTKGPGTGQDVRIVGRRMTTRGNSCTNGPFVLVHDDNYYTGLSSEFKGPYYDV